MGTYDKILNMLENEFKVGKCTNEEYTELKKRILLHAKNHSPEWIQLIKRIESSTQGSYLPLGRLTKILKHHIKPYLEPGERRSMFNRQKAKSVTQSTRINQSFEKKNRQEKFYPRPKEEVIHKTEYNRPVTVEKNIEAPKVPSPKVIIKKQSITYFFPFPDMKGFFWNDKKSDIEQASSAYVLKIKNENSNTGEYTLLTNKDKIVKNAIINQKSFLKPVCDIIEETGTQKIIVKKTGLLEKKQDRWYPVEGKILQITII